MSVRPRVGVAGFQHETNVFAPGRTRFEDFREAGLWPALCRGDEIVAAFDRQNIPMAGFLGAADGFEVVPLLWAEAEPAGLVETAAFDAIAGEIVERLVAAGPLDALYLDLHGAMVTEAHDDGEAALLAMIRATRPDLPVVASFDLHANLTAEILGALDALAIYRTYPHVDMAATGARAARLVAARLAHGARFALAHRRHPTVLPITAQSTRRRPADGLYAMLPDLEGEGVVAVDLALGFPPADVPCVGPVAVACGPDAAAVARAVDRVAEALAAAEDDFDNPLIPAAEAVGRAHDLAARADRPVVLCDPQDNPGAGAPGDATGLLAALVADPVGPAMLGMFWDPRIAARAHAAGVGAVLDDALGGSHPPTGGPALAGRFRVEALSDGEVRCDGPYVGGGTVRLGPMARLSVEGAPELSVVVGSVRAQTADRALFRAVGLDPDAPGVVAVKSAVHFLADFEPGAAAVIFAEAPGANPCDPAAIPYTRLALGTRLGPGGPVFAG